MAYSIEALKPIGQAVLGTPQEPKTPSQLTALAGQYFESALSAPKYKRRGFLDQAVAAANEAQELRVPASYHRVELSRRGTTIKIVYTSQPIPRQEPLSPPIVPAEPTPPEVITLPQEEEYIGLFAAAGKYRVDPSVLQASLRRAILNGFIDPCECQNVTEDGHVDLYGSTYPANKVELVASRLPQLQPKK